MGTLLQDVGFNHSQNDCELGSEVWPASDGNPVVCLLNSLS